MHGAVIGQDLDSALVEQQTMCSIKIRTNHSSPSVNCTTFRSVNLYGDMPWLQYTPLSKRNWVQYTHYLASQACFKAQNRSRKMVHETMTAALIGRGEYTSDNNSPSGQQVMCQIDLSRWIFLSFSPKPLPGIWWTTEPLNNHTTTVSSRSIEADKFKGSYHIFVFAHVLVVLFSPMWSF